MHGLRKASPPASCRLLVLAVLVALVLPGHVSAAASCVSPPPGADQSLYSACLGLASQLATMSLPSNGASVVLTTQVELPVSTSTIYDPFGFPTAVVPVTGASQTSAAGAMSSTTSATISSSESATGAGSSGIQSGAAAPGSSSASQLGTASSTMSTMTQPSTGSSSQTSGLSQAGTSSTAPNGAAAATGSPGVTQTSVDSEDTHYRNTVVIPVAVVCTVVPVLLILACLLLCFRRRKRRRAATLAATSAYGGEDQSRPVAAEDRIDSGLAVNGMTEIKSAGRDPSMRNPATNAQSNTLEHGARGASFGNTTIAATDTSLAGTAAPTNYHSAKPSLGGTGPSSAMESAAELAASGAAATAAAGRPKSRSSIQSRPGSASRLAGWMPGRARADSRTESRQGTARSASNGSGQASITTERPPLLPGMPIDMGSGKWFDGQDPGQNRGREHDELPQAVSLKAGSSIYDERDENTESALSKSPPSGGRPQSSLQGSSIEGGGINRPANAASGFPNPFRTPPTGTSMSSDLGPRQESQSTHRSSDAIPVGGSASTEAAAAARNAEDESLFGPYRPPTPYDELSMMTSARVRGNPSSSYTSPSAVGNVVQGPFNAGTSGNYSRPVPSQIQTPTTATSGSRGTNGASSGVSSGALERLGARASSSRHASPPPSSTQQVMYYPSQEEARTFDFGEGPGSPIGESREMFYDASNDR